MERRIKTLDDVDNAGLVGGKAGMRARRPREFTDDEYDEVSSSDRVRTEAVARFVQHVVARFWQWSGFWQRKTMNS